MSNNWNPNLNLDAPEFVPKFGSGPGTNSTQGKGMPQQPTQPPMGMPVPGMNQYQNQQQFYYSQQQPQPFYQQQQYQMSTANRHPPPHYQQFYYQQHTQFPNQQHFNNHVSNANPLPPQQQPAPQSPNSPSQNNSSQAASDNQINQLTNNLNKLNTSNTAPATASAPSNASTTTSNSKAATPVKIEEPLVKPPVKVTSAESTTTTTTPAVVEPPSVEVEKSIAPSVASIKEDEEWEEETGDTMPDKQLEGNADEVAKTKKKKIVVREYKARKEPINVIFCGHVDAGKSTIGGQIMFLTGMVDKRTLEKYEREAKEKNRESWYLSWALDTNLEEREKGKTVEVGRAFFETEKKHFIILDAPGHKGFVPNMIGGASQADIAVLVISARRGEFETGFEKGGQTREHAMLVKTAGVKYLIVLVNKMDDSTVNWDPARYDEIKEKLTPYLKKCGFAPGKDTYFMPCSGFTGAFIKDPVDESICSWYKGPCFIEYLDTLPMINRTVNGPVRMPIIDKYKDMGTVIMGKIESGMIKLNEKLCVMPNKIKVEVTNIYCEEDETDSAICGENVKLKLKGIEEEEISSGSVLCDLKDTCQAAKVFDAQVVILECPSIICPGFNSIMHIHACTVEVQLKHIIGMVDKKTGEKDLKNRPRFLKQDQIAICRFEIMGSTVACMEPFKLFPQLGRFTLRCESKTVAVGKVLKVIE